MKKTKHPLYKAYYGFLGRQRQTGIKVDMTFWEFAEWWEATGKMDQRGPGPLQYSMSLIDYDKPYNTANVECLTNLDRIKNKERYRHSKVVSHNGVQYLSMQEAKEDSKLEAGVIRYLCTNQLHGWAFV